MAHNWPNEKWFRKLKESRKDFSDVNNVIEVAKFKYEKENHLIEWIIGISLAIFFTLNINITSEINWISTISRIGNILTLLAITFAIWMYIVSLKRQKIAMSWLYREKDKQHNTL